MLSCPLMRLLSRLVGLCAVAVSVFSHRPAQACAVFVPSGTKQAPKVEHEDVLLVWDESTKTQHFIRRATFEAHVKAFAFVVPTPSAPQLAEAPEALFGALESIVKPKEVSETDWKFDATPFLLLSFARSAASSAIPISAAQQITVLSESRVAGMDATVLAATDAKALVQWLNAHDFTLRESAQSWVQRYIDKKWTFTAFRYVRPDVASLESIARAESQTVRLSFKTDAPVYPYMEPSDARPTPGRELRLWVVGTDRRAFELETPGSVQPTSSTVFAGKTTLALGEIGFALPTAPFLTYFVDHTEMRPGEDAVFRAAKDQTAITPPPNVTHVPRTLWIPLDGVVVVAAAIWVVARKRRQRAATR